MPAFQALQRQAGTMHGLGRPSGVAQNSAGPGRASRTCCSASNFNSSEARRLMLLPDGNWFLESSDTEANVYGTSWVMQGHMRSQRRHASSARQEHGLVPLRSRPPTGVIVRQPPAPAGIVPLSAEDIEVAITVLPAVGTSSSTGIVPFQRLLASSSTSSFVSEEEDGSSSCTTSSSSSLAIVPRDGTTMLGVVMNSAVRRRGDDINLPMNDESVYETFNTKNPRRTMKIKFTCKRCGATSIKPVNPHAWRSGSVFARCGKCNVTHKLIDNLKIFHELSGSVFPTPIQPRRDTGSPPPPAAAPAAAAAGAAAPSGNGSGAAADAVPDDALQYDEFGFPLLPPRLRLRLREWPFADGSSDTSRFN